MSSRELRTVQGLDGSAALELTLDRGIVAGVGGLGGEDHDQALLDHVAALAPDLLAACRWLLVDPRSAPLILGEPARPPAGRRPLPLPPSAPGRTPPGRRRRPRPARRPQPPGRRARPRPRAPARRRRGRMASPQRPAPARRPARRGRQDPGRDPASPADLADHLSLPVGVLRDLHREPPWPVAGVRVDAGDLADDLDAALRPLEAALRALETAELDLGMARCQADEAFERGERVLSWVATTLDGLRRLAGE